MANDLTGRKHILAINAHPDDIEFTSGGQPPLFHAPTVQRLVHTPGSRSLPLWRGPTRHWVDITATFAPKMAAIEAHHSQVGHLPSLIEQMSHGNREHGEQGGVTYVEAFKVLHPFCDT